MHQRSARHVVIHMWAIVLAAAIVMIPVASHAETSPTPSPSATADAGTATPDADQCTPPMGQDAIAIALTDSEGRPASDKTVGPPVPGVRFEVLDEGGTSVGDAVTCEDGRAAVPVPERGTYTVKIDTTTLPSGIDLGKGEDERTVQMKLSGTTFVQFPINVETEVIKPFSQKLIDSSVSGVKFGLIIALAALGLSLIFGTTGLTNFGHGELITFGGLVTYTLDRTVGLPVIVAGIVAIFIGAGFGWAQDRALWRPLRSRGTGLIAMMIVSIGFGLFLRNLYQYLYGGSTRSLSQYSNQSRTDYGIVSLADKEIAIIAIALVVIIITCVALMKTRLGKAMRAVSDNPALSASSGMRVDGIISSVWVLGAGLTALAGVLLAVNAQVNFLMGFKLLLLVFAAVTLGGLGTIWGALLGSMIIGLFVELSPLFGVPSGIKEVGALGVLILILLIRPQGILGRRERIG